MPHKPRRLSLSKTLLQPLALGAALLLVGTGTYAQWGASGSLFTEDGIEVTVDARIVSVFAMLNALGFDKEERFGPAPLYRPTYSPGREKARDLLGRPGAAVKRMKVVVDKNAKPTSVYVDAALRLGNAPAFKPPEKRTKKLTRALVAPISEWFSEEGGSAVVRAVVASAGPQQKAIVKAINPKARAISKAFPVKSEEDALLEDTENEKQRVVVIVNPVDMHGTLQRAIINGTHYVVVGPRAKKSDIADVVDAVALTHARSFIDPGLSDLKIDGPIAAAYKQLKKKAKKRLGSERGLAGELLACGLVKAALKSPKGACQTSMVPKSVAKALQPGIDAKVAEWVKTGALLNAAAPGLLSLTSATPAAPADGAAAPAPEAAKAPAAVDKTPAAPGAKKPAPAPAKKAAPAPAKKTP